MEYALEYAAKLVLIAIICVVTYHFGTAITIADPVWHVEIHWEGLVWLWIPLGTPILIWKVLKL